MFFLLVGLEIRRELTAGALATRRAALLPIVAACGGVAVPALIYLAFNPGATAHGWSVPTATDIAFTLGILAVLGTRIPSGLRVFVAALAVVDDLISVLTLAIFYPRAFEPVFLVAVIACIALLVALNRARIYASWPYVLVGLALWLALHATGIHAALAGVALAMCLPHRPAPSATPLLAQAATALAALENAEREAGASAAATAGAPSSIRCGTGRASTCPPPPSGCSRPPIGSSARSRRGPRTSCCRCSRSRRPASRCRSTSRRPVPGACSRGSWPGS